MSKNSKEVELDRGLDKPQDLEAKVSKDKCQSQKNKDKNRRIEEQKSGEQWIRKVNQIASSALQDLGTYFRAKPQKAQETEDDICILYNLNPIRL